MKKVTLSLFIDTVYRLMVQNRFKRWMNKKHLNEFYFFFVSLFAYYYFCHLFCVPKINNKIEIDEQTNKIN
jgi:hypothetical protein